MLTPSQSDVIETGQLQPHFVQEQPYIDPWLIPTPAFGTEVGIDNRFLFDPLTDFGNFDGIQNTVNQGLHAINGSEAIIGDLQSGLSFDRLPPGIGGRNWFAADDVGVRLRNIQPYVAADTLGFPFEDTAVNFAEAAPPFPDSNIQIATHVPNHNPGTELGFDLEALHIEETSPLAHSRVEGLRQLAPQPPLGDIAPFAIDTAPQPRKQRKQRFVCDLPGCETTFGRAAESRRHMRTIHKRHETTGFQCMVNSCSYKSPRQDKVREHMKRMHEICLRVEKS